MGPSSAKTPVAVVLAAGGGTRLGPAAAGRPKALVEIAGEALLTRCVRALTGAGVRELVVATGFGAEQLSTALMECPLEVRLVHNPDWAITQNAVSLLRCREAVGERSFFKLDGDVLFQQEVLDRLAAASAPLAVAVDTGGERDPEQMKVRVEQGRVVAFGKELPVASAAGESIGIERIDASIGARLFSALQRAFEAGRTDLYYEEIYNELIAEEVVVEPIAVADLAWFEIDTPADLAAAERMIRTNKPPGASR